MKTMNMPAFTAEASLSQTNNHYRLTPVAEVFLSNGAIPQMMMTYKEFFNMFDVTPDWVSSAGDPGGSEVGVSRGGCVDRCWDTYRNEIMTCDPTEDQGTLNRCLGQKARKRDLCIRICREAGI